MREIKTVSFTGTQEGMTKMQKACFRELIRAIKPERFIHGDCIGADEQAHRIVREELPDCFIGTRPCTIKNKRAFTDAEQLAEPEPPLDRNKKIVDDGEMLVGTPKGKEELRSGTWSTIRYARKKGRPIVIIDRDGNLD